MKHNTITPKKRRLALIAGIAVGLIAPIVVSSGSVNATAATPATTKYYNAGSATTVNGITVSGLQGQDVYAAITTDQPAVATVAVTMTTDIRLAFGYSKFSGSEIAFTGRQEAINAALASLTLTMPASATSSAVKIKTTFFRYTEGLAYNPQNQHFYRFVQGKISGTNAFAAAATQKEFGLTGYLASITSSDENSFVASKVEGAVNVWIGASDSAKEGEWKWVGGPDDGKQFWTGNCKDVDGKPVEGYFAQWATSEPNNWISGTNKCGGTAYNTSTTELGEDCVTTNWFVSGETIAVERFGFWNDLPCDYSARGNGVAPIGGYVVEFGTKTEGSTYESGVDIKEHTLVKAVPTQKLSPFLTKLKSFFSNFSKTDLKKGFKIFARKPATKTKPAQTIKCPPMKKTRLSYTLLFEEAGRYSFYFTNDKGKRIPMQCGTKIKTRVITEQISAPVIQSVKAGEKPVITVYLQTSQFGDPRYYPQLNVILKRTDGTLVRIDQPNPPLAGMPIK